MSKPMLLLEASCPNCHTTLTEGQVVHLDAYCKDTNQDGAVFLSAVFGDYSVKTDLPSLQGIREEIATNYKNSVEGTAAPIVDKIAQSFGSEGSKTINGETYQGIRWQIDKQLRGSGSPQMKEALYGLRGLLDDVVEPAIKPWRLAIAGRRAMGASPLANVRLSGACDMHPPLPR